MIWMRLGMSRLWIRDGSIGALWNLKFCEETVDRILQTLESRSVLNNYCDTVCGTEYIKGVRNGMTEFYLGRLLARAYQDCAFFDPIGVGFCQACWVSASHDIHRTLPTNFQLFSFKGIFLETTTTFCAHSPWLMNKKQFSNTTIPIARLLLSHRQRWISPTARLSSQSTYLQHNEHNSVFRAMIR